MDLRYACSLCEGAAFLIVDATRYAGREDYLRPCKFRVQASYCPSCGRELPCKPTAMVGDGGDGVGQ